MCGSNSFEGATEGAISLLGIPGAEVVADRKRTVKCGLLREFLRLLLLTIQPFEQKLRRVSGLFRRHTSVDRREPFGRQERAELLCVRRQWFELLSHSSHSDCPVHH